MRLDNSDLTGQQYVAIKMHVIEGAYFDNYNMAFDQASDAKNDSIFISFDDQNCLLFTIGFYYYSTFLILIILYFKTFG